MTFVYASSGISLKPGPTGGGVSRMLFGHRLQIFRHENCRAAARRRTEVLAIRTPPAKDARSLVFEGGDYWPQTWII